MSTDIHKVVIVGGGAAGLELATDLGNRLGKKGKAEITLIDAHRTHIWKPLLHQVASGSFDPGEHALEYLAQARWHHFKFRLGYMDELDRVEKRVWVAPTVNEDGEQLIPRRSFGYDTLIMAVGSISNDFGIKGVGEHCLLLDTKDQAVAFQKTLLESLIKGNTGGELEPGQLDVAIVGGGATGVELAAQLHQVTRVLSQYGFDEINPDRHIRIHVIDAGPRILPALPERISADVTSELERLGITVHVSERITEVTKQGVKTADGDFIPAAIKVWAAGIKAPDFFKDLGLTINGLNQIKVRKDSLSEDDSNIFAIGDCASFPVGDDGETVPPRAQAAHQQASFVARAVMRRLSGREDLGEYRYRDYGSLVTLGRYSTVGSLMGSLAGNVRVSGFIARMVYLSLYKMHQLALHGWWRTGLLTLVQALRRTVDPSVKLH